MLDHASLGVRDLEVSKAFFATVLAPLGMVKLAEREGRVGFGKRYPELWLNHRPHMAVVADDTGSHLCLRAPSEDGVRQFHAAALASGGRDDGPPSVRQATMTTYFAAFIRDPDGNRIEAAVFPGATTAPLEASP